MGKSSILFLLIIFLLIFGCVNNFEKNKIWENFKQSIKEKEYEYLVENSFDSIKCIDCVPNETEKLQSNKNIFKNYLDRFYNKKLLESKQYSTFENDSLLRISYDFNNKLGNEAYNIIYMFNKKEGKFLLKGMITVP